MASREGVSMLHNNITAEQPLITVLLSISTPLNWPVPVVKFKTRAEFVATAETAGVQYRRTQLETLPTCTVKL